MEGKKVEHLLFTVDSCAPLDFESCDCIFFRDNKSNLRDRRHRLPGQLSVECKFESDTNQQILLLRSNSPLCRKRAVCAHAPRGRASAATGTCILPAPGRGQPGGRGFSSCRAGADSAHSEQKDTARSRCACLHSFQTNAPCLEALSSKHFPRGMVTS